VPVELLHEPRASELGKYLGRLKRELAARKPHIRAARRAVVHYLIPIGGYQDQSRRAGPNPARRDAR
jgi:hypothetical protein